VAATSSDDVKKGIDEYVDIFRDLRDRSPPHTAVFKLVLSVIRTEPDIKVAAGKLNLRCECESSLVCLSAPPALACLGEDQTKAPGEHGGRLAKAQLPTPPANPRLYAREDKMCLLYCKP